MFHIGTNRECLITDSSKNRECVNPALKINVHVLYQQRSVEEESRQASPVGISQNSQGAC